MVLNGVFSAAEIAIALGAQDAPRRARRRRPSGARVGRSGCAREPERFLATVQIGITVVGTTAAAFGGDRLAEHFAALARRARAPALGAHAHGVALVLVIALVSFLEIVVGELVPKSIALRSAEHRGDRARLAAAGDGLGRAAARVGAHARLERGAPALRRQDQLHRDAALARGDPGAGRGGRPRRARSTPGRSEIASRAIDFRELTAADVMVLREAIVSVSQQRRPAGELVEMLARAALRARAGVRGRPRERRGLRRA